MIVRQATAGDWAALWPIWHRVVAAGDTFMIDPATGEDDARAEWLAPPPVYTCLAERDGRALGTARLGPVGGGPGAHVAIAGFMVDPAAGGRGVGRALGEHVLAVARQQGYLSMRFNAVVETNERAVRLWRSLGFTVLGTVPAAFRHPEHGLVGVHVMHREL